MSNQRKRPGLQRCGAAGYPTLCLTLAGRFAASPPQRYELGADNSTRRVPHRSPLFERWVCFTPSDLEGTQRRCHGSSTLRAAAYPTLCLTLARGFCRKSPANVMNRGPELHPTGAPPFALFERWVCFPPSDLHEQSKEAPRPFNVAAAAYPTLCLTLAGAFAASPPRRYEPRSRTPPQGCPTVRAVRTVGLFPALGPVHGQSRKPPGFYPSATASLLNKY